MNGWSLWKRYSTRLAVGSLALSLGLGTPAAAQLPLTLPAYSGPARTGAPVVATPTARTQTDAPPQEAPKQEILRDTPKTEAPPAVVGESAASCATCGSQGHSLFGLFNPRHNIGGCGAGGCGSGGCSSCGSRGCVNGTCGPQACYSCGYSGCFPGHQNCCPIDESGGPIHRFFACVYHCICCPDPCYEPRYIVEANSAFWVDSARPATMTRVRWDSARSFAQPDRSEWFWARSGGGGKGPTLAANSIDYNSLAFYQEASTGRASIFIEQSYLSVSPDNAAQTSGFGDMNVGTKGLLLDCELMQITFQFRTYIPVGSFRKGLGAGHVSLEPSLLATVKLLPETYFQGQLSEWIPIAGDPAFAGSILHYHASLNHVLYRCQPDIPFIGTLEFNGYSFQDGLFTPGPGLAPVMSSGNTWMTAGPGLRTAICNKLDFGVSAVFAIGANGSPEQIYRTEARFRF